MSKDGDFKLLKIQNCVLKVSIHCDGCKQKVKKLLQRIEGVYQVIIDSEQQRVTVSGSVDSEKLINKLVRAGKHAQLWPHKPSLNQNQNQNHNQNQKKSCIKDCKNKAQKPNGIQEPFKNKQNLPPFISDDEDDEDCFDDDEEEEDDDLGEEELSLLKEKMKQLTILRQQQQQLQKQHHQLQKQHESNNSKDSNSKIGPKASKNTSNVIDHKTMASLNTRPSGGNGIHPMMPNLGGFQGMSQPAGMQAQAQNPATMFMNMNPNQADAMVMQNKQAQMMMQQQQAQMMMQQHAAQQAQMMYNRSSLMAPNTGYYYFNNGHYPSPSPSPNDDHPQYQESSYATEAAHVFSDDNTSNCSIM